MKKLAIAMLCIFGLNSLSAQPKNMYQKGWIDFNKNGVKDIFEDPTAPLGASL